MSISGACSFFLPFCFALSCSLALFSGAKIASAQSIEDAITGLFESHVRTCGAVLSEPQTFLDNLSGLYPAGASAVSSTPDGQLFRISLSEQNGAINTQYSRYIIADSGRENCATYFSDYLNFNDAAALSQAFETHFVARYGAENLRGGQMPQFYSDGSAGSDVLQKDDNAFEYLMAGLLPLEDVLTVSAVQGGYVSLVSVRGIAAK